MKSWSTKKLGEVLISSDNGVWGSEDLGNGIKILRSTNFNNEGTINFDNVALRRVENRNLNGKKLQRGDILLERSGGGPKQPVGRVVYFNNNNIYYFGNFITRIRSISAIYPKFLFYTLFNFHQKGITNKLQKQTTGIRNLRFKEYLSLQIPFPPLPEQRRIVEKIEEVFEKIDKAKKLREEAIKDTENLIPSALNQIFSRAEKERWERKRFEEISMVNPSKTEIRNLPNDLKVTFVPMKAIDGETGTILSPTIRKLKEVRKGYTYFKEGDILFAKITPCMENGKSAIARKLMDGIGFGSTEFHVLRPTDKILARLLHLFIQQKTFREEASKRFTGTAGQQRVPEEFLKNAVISLPPLPEQHRIVKYLDSLQSDVESLKELQSQTQKELEELKKSILDKAFKGEL